MSNIEHERGILVEKQNDLLRAMPHEAIAHGASVPFVVVHNERFCPTGFLLELGCGDGANAEDYRGWYGWQGVDINEDAVNAARAKGYLVRQGDARNLFSTLGYTTTGMIENFDGVLIQGLLANIVSNADVRSVLRTVDMALKPGGWVFIAEPIRFDKAIMEDRLLDHEVEGHTMREWQNMWKIRYQMNNEAGLPMGIFAVAKPGPDKNALEWSQDPEVLRQLIAGPQLERFARHVSHDSLAMYLRRLNFLPYYNLPRIMESRSGALLLGTVVAYRKEYGMQGKRKTHLYKYHPWYKGHTEQERLEMQEWRQRFKHHTPELYVREFEKRFRANVPERQRPPKGFYFNLF